MVSLFLLFPSSFSFLPSFLSPLPPYFTVPIVFLAFPLFFVQLCSPALWTTYELLKELSDNFGLTSEVYRFMKFFFFGGQIFIFNVGRLFLCIHLLSSLKLKVKFKTIFSNFLGKIDRGLAPISRHRSLEGTLLPSWAGLNFRFTCEP